MRVDGQAYLDDMHPGEKTNSFLAAETQECKSQRVDGVMSGSGLCFFSSLRREVEEEEEEEAGV